MEIAIVTDTETELTSLRAENARLLEHNRILLAQASAGQVKPEKVIDSNAMGTNGPIDCKPSTKIRQRERVIIDTSQSERRL